MKNKIMTMAMMAAIGLFTVNSYANNFSTITPSAIECNGGHECSDKCKKDKDGKCSEASATSNKENREKAKCCSKSEKSCHGKKGKSGDEQKDKAVKTTKS